MLCRKTQIKKAVSLSSDLKHYNNRTVFILLNLVNLQMKWKAVSLMNTDSFFDFWDKSDPYLKFIKIRSDNTFIEAQRTEVIPNNLNPSWKPI